MTSLEAIPVPVDAFAVRQIGEETILLAEQGEELHTLDEVGTFIWQSINGSRPLKEVLDRVCSEYEVSREVAQRDLLRFIESVSRLQPYRDRLGHFADEIAELPRKIAQQFQCRLAGCAMKGNTRFTVAQFVAQHK